MWESWRTYLCFALAGVIFALTQLLSGGIGSGGARPTRSETTASGERSARDARIETSGRGAVSLAGDALLMVPVPQSADRRQTD